MSIEPHQQRVIEEKRELDEKLSKLTAFLNSAASTQLSVAEVRLMSEQLGHMMGYSAALLKRLVLWGLMPPVNQQESR